MAKMDEGRFESCIGDSPAQIQMCMNCAYKECIDCLSSFSTPSYKDVSDNFEEIREIKKHKKTLTKGDRDILCHYLTANSDIEIAMTTGRNPSTVCDIRKRLGLPALKFVAPSMKRKLVATWFEK